MSIHSPAFDDLTLLQTDLLSVVFDTSASMYISPYKMDFVGPMNPLPEPRTLGGMAHVTPIAGIGIVNGYSAQVPVLSPSTLTSTTSPMLALAY